MKYIALCIIVHLLKSILTSSDVDIAKLMLDSVLNSLPMNSKSSFDLRYSNYNVNVNSIRIFKALTPTMEVKSSKHSIEAKDMTMTLACNLKISMQREYNYNDFLIQFKILSLILSEDLNKRKYRVENMSLDNMFISKLHDVVSSSTFKQFTQDDKGILNGLKEIVSEVFNDTLAKENLYYFDMKEIMDKLNSTLTKYPISIPYPIGCSLKYVTAFNYTIDPNDQIMQGFVISREVTFEFEFTVVDVNTQETTYLNETGKFQCYKSIMNHFVASGFRSSKFSQETAHDFYEVVFLELFNKYSKEKQDEEEMNDKEDDYKGIYYDL